MFILDPDPYSLPSYRIGPFTTKDLAINSRLGDDRSIDQYTNERFGNNTLTYTENGRKAIRLALEYYKLAKDDVVTIFTTSGNFYISGCVTREIENFCQWSRKIEDGTKLIFVNHEFGYPYPDLEDLKKYGFPIIEDCANSFFSVDTKNQIGRVGDFVIYSFPKIFPIQVGGLLKSNVPGYQSDYEMDQRLKQYIKNVLSTYIGGRETMNARRIRNYRYLQEHFNLLGLPARFPLEEGMIPGVFMFRVPNETLSLVQLKEHFYAHGIQCSVFYGERSFFIPCHQALEETDLDYFLEVMQGFISKEIRND